VQLSNYRIEGCVKQKLKRDVDGKIYVQYSTFDIIKHEDVMRMFPELAT
jgi:hypothetical protein